MLGTFQITFLEVNDNREVNPNILWDTLKAVIRGKFISLSTAIKKEREANLKRLEGELKKLEEHSENQKPQMMTAIADIRHQILNIYKDNLEKKT